MLTGIAEMRAYRRHMRALRYLRTSADGGYAVLETADGGEQFHLPIDAALRDAVRSDLPRLSPSESEPEPAIGPREIQVRVRAGEDPRQLAEDNAMSLERVLRFAQPVLDERVRMADEARRARARRSTTEGQSVVFGEAVDARYAAHGIDPTEVRWDSRRRDDGQWIIVASWVGGESERSAEWAFHTGGRSVVPIDDTAADLLSDRPIHPIAPPEPPAPAPALAGVVPFPAAPGARTGPLPRTDEVFDQAAYDAGLGIAVGDPDEDADLGVEVATHEEYEAPPLPLGLADPMPTPAVGERTTPLPRLTNLGVTRREPTEEERAQRSRIPSWDDILLGVRRKGD